MFPLNLQLKFFILSLNLSTFQHKKLTKAARNK